MSNTLSSILSLLVIALLCSCVSDDKVKEEALASISQGPETEKIVLNAGEDATFAGPKTTIEFAESTYEYGNVKSGDIVTHDFEFVNTGKEPLIIKNVTASCGCTAPNWPKEPIAPGKSGSITAEFNTAGKSGTQVKTLTVSSNNKEGDMTLTLKGEVALEDTES